jgi:hypothetical protein
MASRRPRSERIVQALGVLKTAKASEYQMSNQHPTKCPACGSEHVAALLFEAPGSNPKLQEDLKQRRAVPAGRLSTGNDPRWRCLKCRHEWGHPHGASGSSPGRDNLA